MTDELELDEIKVNSTFTLTFKTKRQLADLKHTTGKDMSEILCELVAAEHARLLTQRPADRDVLVSRGVPDLTVIGA